MVADAGDSARWCSGPAVTVNVALLVLPPVLPVTGCAPATEAVQVAPVQEPSGAIVKVVFAVTLPSELLNWSKPCAVYACEVPEMIVADAGARPRWSRAAALTCRLAVPVLPPLVPVTVCAPAVVAVQVAPVQEPSGAIVNVVVPVRLPSGLLNWSRPCAVED